jgi:hypothetical protein
MPRCLRCQREISETVHRPEAYRIDGFRLHTGKTRRVHTQTEDGHAHSYLQLSDVDNVHLCVDCFRRPGMKDVWLQSFPDIDDLDALRQ